MLLHEEVEEEPSSYWFVCQSQIYWWWYVLGDPRITTEVVRGKSAVSLWIVHLVMGTEQLQKEWYVVTLFRAARVANDLIHWVSILPVPELQLCQVMRQEVQLPHLWIVLELVVEEDEVQRVDTLQVLVEHQHLRYRLSLQSLWRCTKE